MEAQEVNICPLGKEVFTVTPKLKSVYSRLSSKMN